jgi:hypothetical protein
MPARETCPKCGAQSTYSGAYRGSTGFWHCGSRRRLNGAFVRTDFCRLRAAAKAVVQEADDDSLWTPAIEAMSALLEQLE